LDKEGYMPEGYGPFTHISITNLPPLFSSGSTPAPVISRDMACLALELAATEYSFDPGVWRRAGWADIAFYPETGLGRLFPQAETLLDRGRKLLDDLPGWGRFKSIVRFPGNVREAGEPDDATDNERAVLLTHPLPDGRYMIAAAFRGTGGHMLDWAPNIDFVPRDGFHAGFQDLERTFEKSAGYIHFPQTAREMGLNRLSLEDIINEAKREDSRFVIFTTGHSQGGAILQLWVRRLLAEGVLAANIAGCGFASPSVAYGNSQADYEYPVFHIINSDDVTPRVGADRHLGRALVCHADTAQRVACYAGNWEDTEYRAAVRALGTVRGTRDALISVIAFLKAASELPEKDASAILYGLFGYLTPDIALKSAADHALISIRLMLRLLARNYRLLCGEQSDERMLGDRQAEYAARIGRLGPEPCAAILRGALAYPHMLVREPEEGMGAYHYIVNNSMARLREIKE
jgi:hypothetical protein